MSDDFDPEFDKLPDQPVTIGGDKSAAAWHPDKAPCAHEDKWSDGVMWCCTECGHCDYLDPDYTEEDDA